MDDRRSRLLRDEMEREQRAARVLTAARQDSPPSIPENVMPGSGHVLGLPMANPDEPPVYEEILDD